MSAIARKGQPDEVALQGRLFVGAQAFVGKIAHLIVAEVENRNRLSQSASFRPISLIEQRGVTAIGTQGDRRRVAVSASNESGYRNGQGFARRKVDLMCALVCARKHQPEARKEKCAPKKGKDLSCHRREPLSVCTILRSQDVIARRSG